MLYPAFRARIQPSLSRGLHPTIPMPSILALCALFTGDEGERMRDLDQRPQVLSGLALHRIEHQLPHQLLDRSERVGKQAAGLTFHYSRGQLLDALGPAAWGPCVLQELSLLLDVNAI
eukprot:scaffold46533_cov66-Phaeocystis_antarctica.AAC.4